MEATQLVGPNKIRLGVVRVLALVAVQGSAG